MRVNYIYSFLFFVYFTLQFTVTFFESTAFLFNKVLIPIMFIFCAFIAVRGRPIYTKEFILYGLFFLWSLGSIVVAVDTGWWWKYNQVMLGIIMAHFIMIRFFRITNALISFNYAVIISSLYYFYHTLFVKGISIFQLILLHKKATVFGGFTDEKIINPNSIAALICVGVFTSLITLHSKISTIIKIVPFIYLCMSLPLLAFTNSRSSLLTVVVFLILYILIVVLPKKPLLSFLFFIAGIYGVIFTYNNLMKGTFIEQKLETTGKSGSDDDRIYIVQAAASVFMSNPIMGVGAGNYVKHNKKGLYTHNDFFEVATTLGIIGLILYYSMYFILFKKLKRLYQISKDRKQKDKIKVMVCSLIALLILSNFIVIFPDMLFMSYVFCISLLITHELKLLNLPNSQLCVA